MLTSDLLRYEIGERTIMPRYLTRKRAKFYLKIAQDLKLIYQNYIGQPRCELEQALDDYEQDWVGYKILRGLVKILDGFAEFESIEDFNYPEMRQKLFEFVESYRPVIRQIDLMHQNTRELILGKFVSQNGPLPGHLYGDLPEHRTLVKMKRKIEPDELIRRYNLALAQGILYRCVRMDIQVWGSYKTVFRYLKLSRLMHKIRKIKDGYYIEVDGPFSLYKRTQKYGIQLAKFLPGLLLAEKWQMSARVNTEKGGRVFFLNQNCGLSSHYKKGNPFDSSVEETFYNLFEKRKTDWEITREDEVIDLGDTVFIPDFKFKRPDGRLALLEIVGFWTPEYLQKKLDKLNRTNRNDIIFAVSESLNCSRSNFNGPVVYYKTRVRVGEVLKVLNEEF